MNKKVLVQITLGIVCLLSFITVISLSVKYAQEKRNALSAIKQDAQKETHAAAQKIGQFVQALVPAVNELAQELSEKDFDEQEIVARLQKKPDSIAGLGVGFNPKSKKRIAPYIVDKEGRQQLIHLENEIDYTQPEHKWYTEPLKKGAQFIDQQLWTLAEHVLIGFAAPFYTHDKKPAGVIFANQTTEQIKHILNTIYLGKNGYWFILDQDNTILVHPFDKHGQEKNKLHDILNKSQKKESIEQLTAQFKENQSGVIDYENEIDGRSSWLFVEPIPSTPWKLLRVFPQGEIPFDNNSIRKTVMLLSLAFLVFLILCILFITVFMNLSTVKLWTVSFIVSTLLVLEIALLWYIIWQLPTHRSNLIPINDKIGLCAFLDTIKQKHTTHDKETLHEQTEQEIENITSDIKKSPSITGNIQRVLQEQCKQRKYVPTGIYIQHLKFKTERQIEMAALIWQRYYPGIHDSVSRGFILPQASVNKMEKIHESKEFDAQTIIWQVRATLNQTLMYVKYPFDIKDLQIQITHKDFDENIVLIPDLASYKLIYPTALPGVNKELKLPGWNIANSYFGYKMTDYDTAFGLYSYGPQGMYKQLEKCNQPELYFNVTVHRKLINTLIADMLPITLIALLLFILLLAFDRIGYALLGVIASIFFGAIIAQSRFRGKIESFNLIYFETFYLVIYVAMIAVALVSLFYMLEVKIPVIHYKKNLVAKILYWPVILSTLILITFKYFY